MKGKRLKKKPTNKQLDEILCSHLDWLFGLDKKGKPADFEYANLSHLDLHNVMLPSANFRYAKLRGTDFHDAELSGADLSYSELEYADLRNATLREADLRYAKLSDAKLDGVILSNISVNDETALSECMLQVVSLGGYYKSPVCTQYFAERDLVQSSLVDLEKGVSLDEFAAYIDEHYPHDVEEEYFMRDQYLALLELFRAMRRIVEIRKSIAGKDREV